MPVDRVDSFSFIKYLTPSFQGFESIEQFNCVSCPFSCSVRTRLHFSSHQEGLRMFQCGLIPFVFVGCSCLLMFQYLSLTMVRWSERADMTIANFIFFSVHTHIVSMCSALCTSTNKIKKYLQGMRTMKILFNYNFIRPAAGLVKWEVKENKTKILIFSFSVSFVRVKHQLFTESGRRRVYDEEFLCFVGRGPSTIISYLSRTPNGMSLRRNLCFITTAKCEEFEMREEGNLKQWWGWRKREFREIKTPKSKVKWRNVFRGK